MTYEVRDGAGRAPIGEVERSVMSPPRGLASTRVGATAPTRSAGKNVAPWIDAGPADDGRNKKTPDAAGNRRYNRPAPPASLA